MNIALIAHDRKKEDMVNFCIAYQEILRKQFAPPGRPAGWIAEATGFTGFFPTDGGDQQIGPRVAHNRIDLVIFLRDPLTSQPHEPDISALSGRATCIIFRWLRTLPPRGAHQGAGTRRPDWRLIVNLPEEADAAY